MFFSIRPRQLLLLLLGGLLFSVITSANAKNKELDFFYSTDCPHCQEVVDFINENNVIGKTSLVEKEISDRKNYAALFSAIYSCKIKSKIINLPVLWDESSNKCLLGVDAVTNALKEKIHAK